MKLEESTKILGLMAVIAYLAGVVTIAAYAESLDVNTPSLDLFKTRYILTGAIVLAAFMIPGFVGYAASHYVKEKRNNGNTDPESDENPESSTDPESNKKSESSKNPKTNTDSEWKWFRNGILTCLICLALVACVYGSVIHYMQNGQIEVTFPGWAILLLVVISSMAGFVVFVTWLSTENLKGQPQNRVIVHVVKLGSALVAGLLALIFAVIFASTLYTRIPEQFGGGMPKPALITFVNDRTEQARELGIPMQSDGHSSQPVEIIYQDDAQYTVRFSEIDSLGKKRQRTVQLDESMVAGFSSDSKRPRADSLLVATDAESPLPFDESDVVGFVYSEDMNLQSIAPALTSGTAVEVTVRVEHSALDNADMALTFWERDTNNQIGLGTILISGSGVSENSVSARLGGEGDQLVLTMDGSLMKRRIASSDINWVKWVPSENVTDTHGNPCDNSFSSQAVIVDSDEIADPEDVAALAGSTGPRNDRTPENVEDSEV